MKFTLFLCAGLFLSAFCHAQHVKMDTLPNKLKVSLLKDNLFVTDKDHLVPVSIKSLDSLMKRLPNPETLQIDFESTNAEAEKIRAVDNVLRQCHCHITRKSTSFNKY